jgi:hypothetical protein
LLEEIEKAIGAANRGVESTHLSTPVSEKELTNLQRRLRARGCPLPREAARTATDYAQALMRESKIRPLSALVAKLADQERLAFHGKVAEVAEARARGAVLTRSDRSTMWDLTERKSAPRNYQMKIYAQSARALESLLGDLDASKRFEKRGILTQDTIDRLARKGRVVFEKGKYHPVGRLDVTIEPSKVFTRPADSHLYAKRGRSALTGTKDASRLTRGSRIMGAAGTATIVLSEGYLLWEASTSRISDRQLISQSSKPLGGLAGGVPGMLLGGLLGGPLGAAVGGILGAYAGAELASAATEGAYARLDDKQRQEVMTAVLKKFNVPRASGR